MRKTVFLLLLFLTAYVAGIYGSMPLMVLAAAEAAALLVMFVLSRYLGSRLNVAAPAVRCHAQKGKVFSFELEAENSGRLPVSKFRLRVEKGYENCRPDPAELIYGSCAEGREKLSMEAEAGYCGMIWFHVREMRVYDYLSVFSVRKRVEMKWAAAIFPGERSMQIILSSQTAEQNSREWEQPAGTGESFDEIRQIREYRAGDSLRHIHWNQTARSGELWVKEYEGEQSPGIRLLLEWRKPEQSLQRQMDAFYEILSAMTAGLLKAVGMVRVEWYDPRTERLTHMTLTAPGQRRELLMKLYQTEFPQEKIDGGQCGSGRPEGGALCLGTDLVWKKGKNVIWKFSAEKLDEDIISRNYIV